MYRTSLVKQFLQKVEYAGLRFLGAVFGVIPQRYVYSCAKLLGLCTYYCIRLRREDTMANLERAFGDEMTKADLKKIARDAYINISMTFIEMLFVLKPKDQILAMVNMSDITVVKRNMEKGRGLIFVSCHFGSWELNAASLAACGIPLTVVTKRQSNPYVDRFINRYRMGFGMKIIPHGAPVKHIVRALRNHEVIGLISDQDAGKNGVFVNFFGYKASTPQGAARLALKYGTPVVVVMTIRTSPGRYKSIFKEVDVREDDTVETLTQRFTTIMEDIIREHPEQYFWMHRRWKTSPPLEGVLAGENELIESRKELIYEGKR